MTEHSARVFVVALDSASNVATLRKLRASKVVDVVGVAATRARPGSMTIEKSLLRSVDLIPGSQLFKLAGAMIQRQYESTKVTANLRRFAVETGCPFQEVSDINNDAFLESVASQEPDIILSCGCLQIFKEQLIRLPARGCLNFHPSLLPRNKGPSPLFYTLYRGERRAGASLHRLVRGIDCGEIYSQLEIAVDPQETLFSLAAKVTEIAAQVIMEGLQAFMRNVPGRDNTSDRNAYDTYPGRPEWASFFQRGKRIA